MALPHPAGDELGVLRAEIDDQDPVVLRHIGRGCHCPMVSAACDTGAGLVVHLPPKRRAVV
jgi:hypothetical protein